MTDRMKCALADTIIEMLQDLTPDEVFTEEALKDWAAGQGLVPEDEKG